MHSMHIQLKLFASLSELAPGDADRLPIVAGMSIRALLEQHGIPVAKAHLIFVNGIKSALETRLHGGERVGIFPPVAGG